MSGLSTTRQNALLLVAMLITQLLLISGSVKRTDGSTLLEGVVFQGSRPAVAAASAIAGGAGGLVGRLRAIGTARRENEVLRAEMSRLRGELTRYREAALENERLRRLLDMQETIAPRSVGASVLTANLSGQTRMIVIDHGTDEGVRPDLPAVAWGGAVGRVVFAGRHYAKVRLLSDPNAGAAGIVQRTRVQGMVVGRGSGPLAMIYLPAYADVVPGDRVVTSGLGGVFPRGYGIGVVTRVDDPTGVSKTAWIEPEVDYGAIEEVLVLLDAPGDFAGATAEEAPR